MKLELNQQELEIIGKALAARPYAEVYAVIDSINSQLKTEEKNEE